MSHTPEPWSFGYVPPLEANEHRAIACVNACAGMADPEAEIEVMRSKVRRLQDELRNVREQRDKLIVALSKAESNAIGGGE